MNKEKSKLTTEIIDILESNISHIWFYDHEELLMIWEEVEDVFNIYIKAQNHEWEDRETNMSFTDVTYYEHRGDTVTFYDKAGYYQGEINFKIDISKIINREIVLKEFLNE